MNSWLSVLRRYFIAIAAGNLIWEFAHLPLYTLWREGTVGEIVFAALHCTGGDLLIAAGALFAALLVLGSEQWPRIRYHSVAAASIAIGVGYTILSEWLNTEIRGSWAYAEPMPTLPLIGTGLSPLTQWIVVPLAALWWARKSRSATDTRPASGSCADSLNGREHDD